MLELLRTSPGAFALAVAVLLVSLVLHELAHALVADRFGDPTPRHHGRLTLDPLRHLDGLGTLMLVLVGFGWARPVLVQPANFSRRRAGLLAVSLAGVTANLALALAALLALRLLGARLGADGLVATAGSWLANGGPGAPAVAGGLAYAARINVLLAVFNLLPIPPLDGAKALEAIAPGPLGNVLKALDRFGFVLVIALLVLFSEPVFALVDAATRALQGWVL